MTSVILLGHGSRAKGASAGIDHAARNLSARHPELHVQVAHMELCEPSLEEVVSSLREDGHRHVVILPYFLHDGHHLRSDIPKQIQSLSEKWPELHLVLAPHLGFDPRLVDVLEQRLEQVANKRTDA